MAQADPRSFGGKRRRFSKTVMVDTWRGIMRIRKWPRPRGAPRNEKEAYWQEWFREANLCAKYSPPEDQIAAREATKDTPWNIRDLQIKAMRGRMWSFVTPEGRKIFSMAQYEDASEGLDIISQYPGSMLVRGDVYWEYLVPGPAGYVLTSQGENKKPIWAPASAVGGGSLYKAPLLSEFPTWINQGNAVAEQSPQGSLVIAAPPSSLVADARLRVKPYAGAGRKYILGLEVIFADVSGQSAGFFLRESSTGKIIRYNLRWGTDVDTFSLTVDYYTDEKTFTSSIKRSNISSSNRIFLRIRDDGINIYFDYSSDNAAWLNLTSASRTEFLGSIDQVGIGISLGGGGDVGISASFFHYEESAL